MSDYCAYNDETGGFEVPLQAKLRAFSIVVCTCVSAALLTAAGVPAAHFSHVFIDECGHATQVLGTSFFFFFFWALFWEGLCWIEGGTS